MRLDERWEAFASSLRAPLPEGLCSYGREALSLGVPVVRDAAADLLRTLVTLSGPSSILEVGAGVGYSGLLLLTYAPEGARLTTLEKDGERAARAREAFASFGYGSQAEVLEGDASLLLPSLRGPFDFVFLDGAKGQYLGWLPAILALMGPGSVLACDNVLSQGEVLESRFTLPHRDRTRHGRMRGFLHALCQEERLATSILPVGDGVAVSVWKGGRGDG